MPTDKPREPRAVVHAVVLCLQKVGVEVGGPLSGGGKLASCQPAGTSWAEINRGKCVSRKQNVPGSVQPFLTVRPLRSLTWKGVWLSAEAVTSGWCHQWTEEGKREC